MNEHTGLYYIDINVYRYGTEYLYCIEFALIDFSIYICLARVWRCRFLPAVSTGS